VKLTYSEATYEVLDAGIYSAVLKDITEGTGEYGDFLRFEWAALDEDGQATDTAISALCNPVLNSRSKVSGWVAAHLNRGLNLGEEVDLNDCIGKKVMLTLTVEPRKDGQGDRNRVVAVSPLRKRAAAQPQAAEEDEVPF
jgi:hypothetical protein